MQCVGSHPTMSRCVDHASDLLVSFICRIIFALYLINTSVKFIQSLKPLIGLTIEALLFGLFTICMMVDQWDVVVTNLTHIDRLKGADNGFYNPSNQHRQNLKNRPGVHEVFGARKAITSSNDNTRSKFHITWISPFHKVCFPETVREDIFGYTCRPCGGFSAASLFNGIRMDQSSMEMTGRRDVLVSGAAEIV